MSQAERAVPVAYSVVEVSQALGVSKKSIYGAIDTGRLKAVNFGKKLVIPKRELERFLEGNQ